MRNTLVLLACCFLFAIGCAEQKGPNGMKSAAQDKAAMAMVQAGVADRGPAEVADGNFVFHQNAGQGGAAKPADDAVVLAKNQPPAEIPAKRRIVYSASIDLIVADFEESGKKLQQLLDDHNGYIAKSDVGTTTGERRHATWTVRVPVAKFRDAMDAFAKLGHPVSTKQDSQDVTDEFFDLEARLKNKRVEEERLLEHLKKSTGKLDEILKVESELSRVRGEIERAQGRLQLLAKLSELTTIMVSMSLGQTFGESVNAMTTLFKWIGLAVAAIVPWSPLLLLLGGAFWWRVRRSSRKSAPQP
jgi:hypothetical protein